MNLFQGFERLFQKYGIENEEGAEIFVIGSRNEYSFVPPLSDYVKARKIHWIRIIPADGCIPFEIVLPFGSPEAINKVLPSQLQDFFVNHETLEYAWNIVGKAKGGFLISGIAVLREEVFWKPGEMGAEDWRMAIGEPFFALTYLRKQNTLIDLQKAEKSDAWSKNIFIRVHSFDRSMFYVFSGSFCELIRYFNPKVRIPAGTVFQVTRTDEKGGFPELKIALNDVFQKWSSDADSRFPFLAFQQESKKQNMDFSNWSGNREAKVKRTIISSAFLMAFLLAVLWHISTVANSRFFEKEQKGLTEKMKALFKATFPEKVPIYPLEQAKQILIQMKSQTAKKKVNIAAFYVGNPLEMVAKKLEDLFSVHSVLIQPGTLRIQGWADSYANISKAMENLEKVPGISNVKLNSSGMSQSTAPSGKKSLAVELSADFNPEG